MEITTDTDHCRRDCPAEQLDFYLAKARGQVEKLTPSLLARAFAGQLVPQDPTDEPAEKLLERIKERGIKNP